MAEPLPPGLNAERMAEALERFRRIVGSDWVFAGDKVASYDDPYTIPNNPKLYKAHAAVAPASTDEVRAIVKVANAFHVPLWTGGHRSRLSEPLPQLRPNGR